MAIKDTIRVGGALSDADGNKLEPEQQPVTRTVEMPAEARGTETGRVGSMRGTIEIVQPAGIFAEDLRTKCCNCAHFDNPGFLLAKRRLESTAEGRRELNNLRAALLDTGNMAVRDMHADEEGDMNAEHALSTMGLCRAWGEIQKDEVAVHPLANCPSEQNLFKARGVEADRRGSMAYDSIMRAADGEAE